MDDGLNNCILQEPCEEIADIDVDLSELSTCIGENVLEISLVNSHNLGPDINIPRHLQ
jgi:hypothetical protein